MEDYNRQSDYRVPMIAGFFLILLIFGGILLILYCFVPSVAQPWFPAVALVFIGLPWLFWLMTYTYTCIKGCLRSRASQDGQIGRGAPSRTTSNNPEMGRNVSGGTSSMRSQNQGNIGGVLSVTSSREFEEPLNKAGPSS